MSPFECPGEDVPTETGFVASSSFDRSIKESDRYSAAKGFFDRMFCDVDADSGLIADVDGRAGECVRMLSSTAEDIRGFIARNGSSEGAFFTSAFAYTLSRFTGRSDAVFMIVEN